MNDLPIESRQIEWLCEEIKTEPRTERLAKILVGTSLIERAGEGYAHTTIIAACTYLAVREHEEPIKLSEIAMTGNIEEREVYQAATQIEDDIGLKFSVVRPSKYVDDIVEDLNDQFNSNLKDEIADEARHLIHQNAVNISGNDKLGVAAAAVYVTAKRANRRITQDEVATVACVTERTIRNLTNELNSSS